MSKPKLFVWSDSPNVNTGFGKVAKNLLDKANEDFEVYILGINERGIKRYNIDKYFIYSTMPNDMLGFDRLIPVLKDLNPDIIFLFQDIFHVEKAINIIRHEYSPTIPIAVYFPIDGSPYFPVWKSPFSNLIVKKSDENSPEKSVKIDTGQRNVQKIFTYSEFANNEIRRVIPEARRIDLDILYHGVDLENYHILSDADRRVYREKLGWKDKFIMINVNRFQPRKQTSLSLKIGALLSYGYKKCKCGNYYSSSRDRCDLNNCGPDKVLETVEPKLNLGLYIHANREEIVMGAPPSGRLEWHALNAGYPQESVGKTLFMVSQHLIQNPTPEEGMNLFYNCANINMTTALGEGCGLNLLESSATGTTSIAPDNSAIPEQIGDTGHLIPNVGHFNLPHDSGHFRPLVSIPKFIDAVEIEYNKWVANKRRKPINYDARKRMENIFRWEDKAEHLIKELNALVISTNSDSRNLGSPPSTSGK